MTIHPFKAEYCDSVVNVHMHAYSGFFLTFLGPSFLSLLYRSIFSDVSGIVIVACQGPEVIGFVAGSTQPSGQYGRMLKNHLLAFFLASLRGFFQKPRILPRLFRAFRMPNQQLPVKKCATLMSIAVEPSFQGQGVGRLLIKAFLDEVQNRGLEYVNLTTDAVANDTINRFYKSLGFEIFREFTTPEGRAMNEYLYHIQTMQ